MVINMNGKPLTYLASPYSHPSDRVRHDRYIAACRAAGKLMKMGQVVYSPIAHSHGIANECNLPKGWDFWEPIDSGFMIVSSSLVVLCIDGWEESTGVQAEIGMAQDMEIPITHMDGNE